MVVQPKFANLSGRLIGGRLRRGTYGDIVPEALTNEMNCLPGTSRGRIAERRSCDDVY